MPLKPGTAGYLFLLAGFVMLAPVATDMYLATMPDLAIIFGTDAGSVQMTLAIFLMGFAVGNLIHGPMGDRFGRRPVVFITLAIFVLASIACVLAPSIEALAIARFFQAVGASGPGVMARAIVRDAYSNERAPMIMAHLGTLTGLAPIAAPIVGGFLHAAYGWTSIFYVMTLCGFVLAAFTMRTFEETLKPDYRQEIRPLRIAANYRHIIQNRIFLGHTLVSGIGFAGIFAFLSGSSFVFREIYGYSAGAFGVLFGITTIGFLAGTFLSGRLTAFFPSHRIQYLGGGIAAAGGLAMVGLYLSGVHAAWAVAVPQFFYLIGYGIIMPQSFAGALVPFPHMAGTASSLFGFLRLTLSAAAGAVMALSMTGLAVPGAQGPMVIAIGLAGVLTCAANILVPVERKVLMADAATPAGASGPSTVPAPSLAAQPSKPRS